MSENRFTLSAINKIQVGANINILTRLETSLESLGNLQREAGFDMSGGVDPFYITNSLIPKYITSWIGCTSCSLSPTWSNLMRVLRLLDQVKVADEIEKYLKDSTAHLERTKKSEEPLKGIGKLARHLRKGTQSLSVVILSDSESVLTQIN